MDAPGVEQENVAGDDADTNAFRSEEDGDEEDEADKPGEGRAKLVTSSAPQCNSSSTHPAAAFIQESRRGVVTPSPDVAFTSAPALSRACMIDRRVSPPGAAAQCKGESPLSSAQVLALGSAPLLSRISATCTDDSRAAT